MRKEILALLIVVVFLFSLSGCGSGKASSAVIFSETDAGKAAGLDYVMGVRMNSKGRLIVCTAGENNNARYVVLDKDGKEEVSIEFGINSGTSDASVFTLEKKITCMYSYKDQLPMNQQVKQKKSIGKLSSMTQAETSLKRLISEMLRMKEAINIYRI